MKLICAKTHMDTELCDCNPCPAILTQPDTAPKFTAVRMSDIPERPTLWAIDGLLPLSDVAVLVGEEGIGKGLWWIEQVRQITSDGYDVVLIVAEDDPSRTLRPRMQVAGVDTDRVHIIVSDPQMMIGHPYLPTDDAEVEQVIRDTDAQLLVIDPWVSVVPGHLTLKDSQQARGALDPLTVLARRTDCCILAVAHTNRSNGSTRDRVGLTAVLRQAARVLLLALEDPEDDTHILVGVDKANNTRRGPAARWQKLGEGDAWRVQLVDMDSGASIRDWDATFRAMQDGRTSDKWAEVVRTAMTSGGMVTRGLIQAIYGDGHEDAADKAIHRWVASGRLLRHERGVFEVPAAEGDYPPIRKATLHESTGDAGGTSTVTPQTPREKTYGRTTPRINGQAGFDVLLQRLDHPKKEART